MKKEPDHPTKSHTKKHSKLPGFQMAFGPLPHVGHIWWLPTFKPRLPLSAICVLYSQQREKIETSADGKYTLIIYLIMNHKEMEVGSVQLFLKVGVPGYSLLTLSYLF